MAFGKRNAPPAGTFEPSVSPSRGISPVLIDEPAPAASAIPLATAAPYMPLDAYRVGQRFEESRARLAARHEEKSQRAKERFAQVEVRPFCLVAETFWTGQWAELLSSRLDLFPHDDWNIAFLAADQASAALLDLPVVPGAVPSATNDEVGKLLAAAELQLTTAYAGAERARNFSQYAQERDEIRDKLAKLARRVLFAIDEEWTKSKLETAD
jgi:hypothetical protein